MTKYKKLKKQKPNLKEFLSKGIKLDNLKIKRVGGRVRNSYL